LRKPADACSSVIPSGSIVFTRASWPAFLEILVDTGFGTGATGVVVVVVAVVVAAAAGADADDDGEAAVLYEGTAVAVVATDATAVAFFGPPLPPPFTAPPALAAVVAPLVTVLVVALALPVCAVVTV
jgi:hypothetical protein